MNQLIKRTQNNTMPVTVDYEITEFGQSLQHIIDAIGDWGTKYRDHIVSGNKISP
ncbi:winged helix-turn-helix transcriptional regulator [Sphingobacterium sp. NGMCC 1.201703]|uniref:winged helix-turn-helix transcriptional regulator n=1 Tax=Sphingobacterium sp. NGMCC 1.201703 TaxID=3388657 RepID=UPI0039FC108F